jgi:hypothetical protein
MPSIFRCIWQPTWRGTMILGWSITSSGPENGYQKFICWQDVSRR